MNSTCALGYVQDALFWLFVFLLSLVFVTMLAKRNVKKIDDYYKKSWDNQEAMIAILKEIRDAVKK